MALEHDAPQHSHSTNHFQIGSAGRSGDLGLVELQTVDELASEGGVVISWCLFHFDEAPGSTECADLQWIVK